MIGRHRVSPETRRALFEAGWQLLSVAQPPWLFPNDGRKLKLCAVPSDPWHATIFNGHSLLTATRQISAQGATADAAVLAALSEAGPTFREALGRLETAVDGLIGALR